MTALDNGTIVVGFTAVGRDFSFPKMPRPDLGPTQPVSSGGTQQEQWLNTSNAADMNDRLCTATREVHIQNYNVYGVNRKVKKHNNSIGYDQRSCRDS